MVKYRLSEIAKKMKTWNNRGLVVKFNSCKRQSSDLDRFFFFFSFFLLLWKLGSQASDVRSSHRQARLKSESSRTGVRLQGRVPAALQSTLEFLQEHTCTLRSVMFVMGGFPESVTMMGRL